MEVQLNAWCTLLAGVVVYWLGDWLTRHIGVLRRIRFPAPLLGGGIISTICAGADVAIQFHEHVQTALLFASPSMLGFGVRMPKGQAGFERLARQTGRSAWEKRAMKFPPLDSLRTTPGRMGVAVALTAFCMFSGLMVAVSLGQLIRMSIPAWLGGPLVAALLRSTTEMTDDEFPDQELAAFGTASLGILLSVLVMELLSRLFQFI